MMEVRRLARRIAKLEVQLVERDKRIAELEAQLVERDRRIAELEAEVAQLKARIADLEAQRKQNSTNSSKPPSSDKPGSKRTGKSPTGRRPGGQPGHPPHQRELFPPEQVDCFVQIPAPDECAKCHHSLGGEAQEPYRHQVVEIPPIKPVITEYQCQAVTCAHCGARNEGELPQDVATSVFGERLTALISLLVGEYRLSKRLAQELLSEILGVKISLGGLHDREQEMSQATKVPVAQAEEHVRTAPAVNMDETGWYEGKARGRKKLAWLWVAATTLVSVFRIATSRGSEVAKDLLGEKFSGYLTSDRWVGYNWLAPTQRQLCWSHLTRDIQGFIDRGGEGARIGQALMDERDRMFLWWGRVKAGTLSHGMFKWMMQPVERRVGELLWEAVRSAEDKVARSAALILKLECALWTFIHVEGLEPTNNLGERLVRPGVIYRKTSFGTESPDGSRFIERILTVVETLKLQGRNVLEYLTEAIHAYRRGLPPPSILPVSTGPDP